MRRGLPIFQRTSREVIFDPVEVGAWLEVRKTCDPELLNLTPVKIAEEIERTHARAWLWTWGDGARRSDVKLRNAIFALGKVVEDLKDGSDDLGLRHP